MAVIARIRTIAKKKIVRIVLNAVLIVLVTRLFVRIAQIIVVPTVQADQDVSVLTA